MWSANYHDHAVGVGELFQISIENDLMSAVLGSGNERSQRSRLWPALASKSRAFVGAAMMKRLDDHTRTKAAQYRLQFDLPF